MSSQLVSGEDRRECSKGLIIPLLQPSLYFSTFANKSTLGVKELRRCFHLLRSSLPNIVSSTNNRLSMFSDFMCRIDGLKRFARKEADAWMLSHELERHYTERGTITTPGGDNGAFMDCSRQCIMLWQALHQLAALDWPA